MSEHDHSKDLSRRGLGLLALAGAATGLLPATVHAAGDQAGACRPPVIDLPALAVMCIDYRLVDDYVGFFNGAKGPGRKKYDLVSLAGASLACGSPGMFHDTVEAFYQQVGAAYHLHQIKNIVFVDHMGCGAYKEEFNHGCDFTPPEAERTRHLEVMRRVAAEFPVRAARMGLPRIGLDFWLFRDPKHGPVGEPEHIRL